MSDEIDVSHGGAISVDTEALRAIIPRMVSAAECLASAAGNLAAARDELFAVPDAYDRAQTARVLAREVSTEAERMNELAHAVTLMAEAYEIVEERARLEALVLSEANNAQVRELRTTLARREAEHAEAAELADALTRGWRNDRFRDLYEQGWAVAAPLLLVSPLAAPLPSLVLQLFTLAVDRVGRGKVYPGIGMKGTPPHMDLKVIERHPQSMKGREIAATRAPGRLADAYERIPDGDVNVRVETYGMPDGSRQFAVYVAGTGTPPWDMASNIDLYFGEISASYAVTERALEHAGAGRGDIVHAFGYSQGAMIADYLAVNSEFDVRTHGTIGSPSEPVLGDSVRSVRVRHTDDPVASLSGGGMPSGTGALGSVVVQREADPLPGPQDLTAVAHTRERYMETVRLFENSGDVRADLLAPVWAELATATSVDVLEVGAAASDP